MLTLPETLETRIHQLAIQAGQTDVVFIENLLAEYVQDTQDIRELEHSIKRLDQTGEPTISLEQLQAQNGL